MRTNGTMKVCHITSAHRRYDVRIFEKQCVSLAKHGYDVTLLVNDRSGDERVKGVKILSTGIPGENRKDRFLHGKKALLKRAIEVNAQIYQLHDPDLLGLGLKLKKAGKKVVFDSHEDVPASITTKKWIPGFLRGPAYRLYSGYEKRAVSRLDGVISVTPHIVNRLAEKAERAELITNYPIIEERISDEENILKGDQRSELKDIDEMVEIPICFAGGITAQWNHHLILEAIKDLQGIQYHLAGSGSREYLEELKKHPGWKKVKFYGRVSHGEVKEIYEKSQIGIALNYAKQIEGQGTLGNTKLFEYMEAELPILCTEYTLWKELVEKNRCGIAINPRDIDAIRDGIERLTADPDFPEEMGKRGRKAVVEEYNWKTQEEKLLRFYEKVLTEA